MKPQTCSPVGVSTPSKDPTGDSKIELESARRWAVALQQRLEEVRRRILFDHPHADTEHLCPSEANCETCDLLRILDAELVTE